MTRRFAALALPLSLAACHPWTPPALTAVAAPGGPAIAAPVEQRAPVTILISIDGFRADYLDRGVTPTLSRLAADGVRAAMRPSFPSKTAPQHWTIATGLRPDRNGVVSNNFVDPRRPDETFTMASDDPFWWSQSEPVWVTAEKAGIPTATMFWPGSDVAVGGMRDQAWPNDITGGTRPSAWQGFFQPMPEPTRVNALIDWLRRPAAIRPRLLTLYFDTVDTAGHHYGPDAPQTNAAIAAADEAIGRLVTELAGLGQPANLIIVADHGMTAVSRDRLVAFDDLLGKDTYRLVDSGAFATISAAPDQLARVTATLTKPHPHMQCWTPATVPVRFHYGRNPRVAPVVCLAARGWQIKRNRAHASRDGGGDHGFDPADPEMAAVFVASGPAFKANQRLAPFDNVDVAPLVRKLIGLPADRSLDGDDRRFGPVLR